MSAPDDTHGSEGQRGQALVLFALLLVAIIGVAGILMDGGLAWANRRAAQSAADFAALAAAQAIADAGMPCNSTGLAIGQAAANKVSQMNGFPTVTIQYPASGGSFTGCNYVRVQVSRPMDTTFSRIFGEVQWQPTADATVLMTRTIKSVASCTFCSLNKSAGNHTLLIQLGANGSPSTLVVDGDIVVNSSNGKKVNDPNSCQTLTCGKWIVQGDAFDIFGVGGRIQAKRITVVGGWETHDNGIAVATEATCSLDQRPTPPQYLLLTPPITQSNICIHQPVLADPLAGFGVPVYTDFPVRQTKQYKPAGSVTIDPGVYIGGISIGSNVTVTMHPGVYYLAGGGLTVTGSGSIIGDGVTIYNGSVAGKTGKASAININTTGKVVLSPSTSGQFGGMTIMQERASSVGITLNPANGAQCASSAGSGDPQGCLGGLSGTIYAANESATVTVNATGTANLQIIAGKLLVKNGGTARFTYKTQGFASTSTIITLVE